MEDNQGKIVNSVQSNSTARAMKSNLVIIGSGGFMVIVGVGVWSIRAYWEPIGFLIAGITIFVFLTVAAFPFVALLRFLFKREYTEIGPSGTIDSLLWKTHVYAPLDAAPVKAIAEKKTRVVEVTPVVPTFLELLEAGEIAKGTLDMVMGYDKVALGKGILELVKGPWPGTHAVAGKGRSGKTRRVTAEVCQVLIAGGKVTICDPHSKKRDSLVNELKPLAPWLHVIAGDEEAIIEASHEFFTEMERRIDGVSDEVLGCVDDDPDRKIYVPRLIIYDEWPRLMTTDRIEDEDREVMITTAKNCSKEYAGVDGFCCLIGQAWTKESCGSTDIRRLLFDVFVHNLNAEFAAFFFRQSKWKNRAEGLKSRECLYKNYSGDVREIITIGVPDDTAVKVAEYLMQVAPPEKQQELPASEQVQQIAPREKTTGPLPAYPMIEAPVSRYEQEYQNMGSQAQNGRETAREIAPETVIYMPEMGGKRAGNEPETRVTDEAFVKVLREIGKRIKDGESSVEIRKSLGVNTGRAVQEVNAALNFLQEHTDMEVE